MNNLICIAQLNPVIGDIEHNKQKAIEVIQNATKSKVDLVGFAQLYLIGNPTGDIIKRYPQILNQCNSALDEIKQYCTNISALIGYPEIDKTDNNKYYNSVCYIKNNEIKKIIRKQDFLNTNINADDFIIELNNEKFGILIKEDNWDNINICEKNLLEKIAPKVDTLISVSLSSSRCNKEYLRNEFLKSTAEKYSVNHIYINQTGANDEMVYEGLSRMYDKNGSIVARAEAFFEQCLIVNTNSGGDIAPLIRGIDKKIENEFSLNFENDLERTYKAIVYSIKEYFSKNGIKRATLGLSGGLDSSVCAVLLTDALGKENVFGISMPSKITSQDSKTDAEKLAQNLGIHFFEVPIKDTYSLLNEKFENIFNNVGWCERYKKSYTKDNIQARMRATILWGISNEYPQTIPIATSDKSESYMGYATINGDMSGGYAPIADVTKTKLFALARWINKNREVKNAIPENVILKPPGAELAINPETGKTLTAEEALMPYEFLDEVIWRIENLHQTTDDMMKSKFLYEKKNSIDKNLKQKWLEKFSNRLNSALYKWSIAAPSPIIDSHSINKAEFRQPITSNIKL